MKHDFGPGGRHDIRFDGKGRLCTYQNGVMDYGLLKRKDKFSSCSKDDYIQFYRQGGLFCFWLYVDINCVNSNLIVIGADCKCVIFNLIKGY